MFRLRFRPIAAALCILGFGFGFGLGGSACVMPNPNHCQNLALDPNVWCSAHYGEDRPFCSPCTAEHNGCVSEEPSEAECPEYSPRPASETDTGATDTGATDTGEAGEMGETSETGGTETG